LADIEGIAQRYPVPVREDEQMASRATILQRGWLTKSELQEIAHWKAPRSAAHAWKNSDDYVVEVARFAFAAECERTRIEVLTLLDGVSWPTASVVLHLFHRDPYPILDFRALWSVSLGVPSSYTFDFWWPYVEFCRKTAEEAGVDMRTLDRALWQYSKENQRNGGQGDGYEGVGIDSHPVTRNANPPQSHGEPSSERNRTAGGMLRRGAAVRAR
jgi:hypothetical protein